MVQRRVDSPASLYETDETAWLEGTAELVRLGSWDQIDSDSLAEYLTDMARRDRREVLSRLAVLIAHLLKWRHQPERRSGGWRETIESQRQELEGLLASATLRNHADQILEKAYGNGVRLAVSETGLAEATFPAECPYSVEDLLAETMEGM
jgi:Domain of unknown function DUF29